MSDRPHNKDLEDLLKNFKTKQGEGLDDFEREALEGFDMLDSKEDALHLKSSLDKRIHEELFEDKKNNHKVYWFAAAGLFLVIGLSVFFILNNPTAPDKNVAYVQPSEKKELEKETVTLAPTAETTTGESIAAEKTATPALKNNFKSLKEDEEQKGEGGVKSRAVLKPGANTKAINESPVADNRSDNDKDAAALDETKQSKKDASSESIADAEPKKAEEKNERETTGKMSDEFASTEPRLQDKETAKNLKKSGKNKSKERVPAAEVSQDDSKYAAEKTPVNTGVASNNVTPATSVSAKGAGAEQKVSAPSNNGPVRAEEYNSPDNTCYYKGGETLLTKDLREKLIDKNINKKFDVLLNINEKKKVEKVNYLNVYDLTTEERDRVTEILKSLDKFEFYIQPNKKSLFEFKLLYRP